MNAVEIEQAVSDLAEAAAFNGPEFPFAFLQAFGAKETTLKRLRTGASNRSDVGGVLQANNIHIAVAPAGEVAETLDALRASPATTRGKARFILATDGADFQAEDLTTGETVVCAYADFPNHFGFFLPLAGITTVRQIRESAFDIRATSRLNKLYIELLKDNPEWGTPERRRDMNHFMARLIFCFFAEDTDIFNGDGLFTATVSQMSERDSSNTDAVIGEIFRAMNTSIAERPTSGLRPWADAFPYVNGGLFSGDASTPRFSRVARAYLLHIGGLDWTQINPDIFGSMIQAVADDEERGALGMHYTSVPNILKVLDPLFLDDLRAKLDEAGDNPRTLLNLRRRMSRIRVFDPACGSGNFLVIAYKQMRAIEAKINQRRGERDRRSEIPLTSFRGIELRDFAAEIARLALIIAEYQCDVLYRGQKEALAEFLPLDAENWIGCDNSLRLDWLTVSPPAGPAVEVRSFDLFDGPAGLRKIDFENEGGETYVCGNRPYVGSVRQSLAQKNDLKEIFERYTKEWKSLDYVAGWFLKVSEYNKISGAKSAFVATNSICQGEQVPILWPIILDMGQNIFFARRSFKWSNLAAHNAGVTVVVIGLSTANSQSRVLYDVEDQGMESAKIVDNISPYLIPGSNVFVRGASKANDARARMVRGNMPNDGGHLVLSPAEALRIQSNPTSRDFVRRFVGSQELINGTQKYCLWIEDDQLDLALASSEIRRRVDGVRQARLVGGQQARSFVETPHKFVFAPHEGVKAVVVPRVSSEGREYLPVGLVDEHVIVSERNFALYGAPQWNLSVIASRMHCAWVGTVCARHEMRFSYSNSLGWNVFPIPTLTEKNKSDLTQCAEDILLAREAHFPATIADLYDPEAMPADLRAAHDRNDETLERIYIGRRFRNDTERLEKLFELYTKMVAGKSKAR